MNTYDPLPVMLARDPAVARGASRSEAESAERDRLQRAVSQVRGLSGNLRLMLDGLLPTDAESPVGGAVAALLNRLDQGLDEVDVLSRLLGEDPHGLALQVPQDSDAARILVVDSCNNMLHSVGDHLREAGYEVVLAGSAQQGLELLRNTPCMALVIDVEMPFLDGLEWLAACARALPLIVMASNPSPADSRRALSLGAVACLPKDGRVSDEILSCLRIIQEPSRSLSPS